jgi:hypothetical protein
MGDIERSKVGILRWSTMSDRWQVEQAPDTWPRDGATVEVVRTADTQGAVEERDRLRALLKQVYDRHLTGPPIAPIEWYDDVARYLGGQ